MYKIKDIFDFDSNEDNKKDSQLERMKHLNETYSKRGEFIKEESNKEVDSQKIKEESERLKKLSNHRLNENGNYPFAIGTQPGIGKTVTTFMPTNGINGQRNASSFLKPDEALEISIKRAIESGSPVNNMGFYDEVNWQLNNLGFDSKLPLDIKNCLVKIIGKDINTTVD